MTRYLVALLALAAGAGSSRAAPRPVDALAPSIAIIDYRATPETERLVAALLEACDLPYILGRAHGGWGRLDVFRLYISVRSADVSRVDEMLRAVSVSGALATMTDDSDLKSR